MVISTTHFGRLTVEESATLDFPRGLPGFEDCRGFAPFQHPAHEGLIFLQSLERPGLCFLTLPVRALRPDYQLLAEPEDLEYLGLDPDRQPEIGREVAVMAILTFVEGREPTANLLSPLVIRVATRRGVQAIRPDGAYRCREPWLGPVAAC